MTDFTFRSVAEIKSLHDGRTMRDELVARGESLESIECWGLGLRADRMSHVVLDENHWSYRVMIGASFMILAARELGQQ